MSSTITEQPIKSHNKSHKRSGPNFNPNAPKKFLKGGGGGGSSRKRSKSFSGCGGGSQKIKNLKPVLPTKFLLGGNINDPLNLNSLQDEAVNRAVNAVTPKSSPLPTPPRRRGKVEVIIPLNCGDPLHLIDCADDADYELQLSSPLKKGRKKRARKRRTTSGTSDAEVGVAAEAKTPEASKDSAKIPEGTDLSPRIRTLSLDLPSAAKKGKRKCGGDDAKEGVFKKLKYAMDKIVSPVVPQPGAWLKRSANRNVVGVHRLQRGQNKDANRVMPQFKDKNRQYQYGNYNRYYGYRNPQQEIDARLKCFAYNRALFEGKDILDIGCNIGHITLSVARDFGAHSIVGIDIDKNLIGIARKNIKHYVSSSQSAFNAGQSAHSGGQLACSEGQSTHSGLIDALAKTSEFFPISMPILYGPIDVPGFKENRKGQGFPHNVTFLQGNYVLEDDSLISTEQPQFDVILCLSITKWIHLNWGDGGIKQAFRRMYAQLRPGGRLVLEPQNWASYKGKKKLTEAIYKNYNTIEFFPDKFTQYLLSSEVGFAKSEILGCPAAQSKGFQRPIHVYTKSTMYPSERVVESGSSVHGHETCGGSTRVYVPAPTPPDGSDTNYPSPVQVNASVCCHQAALDDALEPITSDLEPLSSHLSPINNSLVTLNNNVSPTNNDLSRINPDLPTNNDLSPIHTDLPSNNNLTPINSNLVPIISDLSPTNSDASLIISDLSLISNSLVSNFSDSTPIMATIDDSLPIINSLAPIISDLVPKVSDLTPIMASNNDSLPIGDHLVPSVSRLSPRTRHFVPTISDLSLTNSDLTPIISDLSPATGDLVPLNSNLLPINNNLVIIMNHLSPRTRTFAPLNSDPSLIISDLTPTIGDLVPVISDLAPSHSNLSLINSDLVSNNNLSPINSNLVPIISDFAPTNSDPSLIISDPSLIISDPSLIIGDPSLIISDPSLIISDPSLIISDPSLIISDPSLIISDPSLIISDPSLIISDPSLIINDPSLIINDPSLIISDPSLIISDPSLIISDFAPTNSDPSLIISDPSLIISDFAPTNSDPSLSISDLSLISNSLLPTDSNLAPIISDSDFAPTNRNLASNNSLTPIISDLAPNNNLTPVIGDLEPTISDLSPTSSDLAPTSSDLRPNSDLGPIIEQSSNCTDVT